MYNFFLIKIGITLIFGIFTGIVLGTIILITYIIPDYMHVYIPSHDQDTKLWLSLAAFLFTVIGFVIALAGIISPAMQFLSNKNFLEEQKLEWDKTQKEVTEALGTIGIEQGDLTRELNELKALKEEHDAQLVILEESNNQQKNMIKKLEFYHSNHAKIIELKGWYLKFLLDIDATNERHAYDNQDNVTTNPVNLVKELELQKIEGLLWGVSNNAIDILKELNKLLDFSSSLVEGSGERVKERIADYLCWLYQQGMFDEGGNALDLKKTFEALMKDYFGRGNFW